MKFIVLIPDGSSDEPLEELGGRTPLTAAATPNFDRLAAAGRVGLASTIPPGLPAGSDVANLSVMGYDPNRYYTGRAPLEAASLGIALGRDDVAFRCNLVCVRDGIMEDFTAGHISSGEAAELIVFLHEQLGGRKAAFHPGLSYRHIMVSSGRGLAARCTPPHDISGQPIAGHLPAGEDGYWLRTLMESSVPLLEEHSVNRRRVAEGKPPANMIWLWGQGKAPVMPPLRQRFGITGAVISAVDLVKGLGKYAGLDVIDVPGATGYLDTDYGAKARAALSALESHDFIYVHVEAPDEASHEGDVSAKVEAIERFDAELAGPLLEGLEKAGPFRLLAMPDHATPVRTMTHSDAPVPFLLFDSAGPKEAGRSFDEPSAAAGKLRFDEPSAAAGKLRFERAWEIMPWFLGKE